MKINEAIKLDTKVDEFHLSLNIRRINLKMWENFSESTISHYKEKYDTEEPILLNAHIGNNISSIMPELSGLLVDQLSTKLNSDDSTIDSIVVSPQDLSSLCLHLDLDDVDLHNLKKKKSFEQTIDLQVLGGVITVNHLFNKIKQFKL